MTKRKAVWFFVSLILVIVAAAFSIGGGFGMKQTVKEENRSLDGISEISVCANIADVRFILTDDQKLTVTQYSMRKVSGDQLFVMTAENGVLTLADHSKPMEYLFGLKMGPGISYTIHLPSSYSGKLKVVLNDGNIWFDGAGRTFTFGNLNVRDAHGNITISKLKIAGDSEVKTGDGNINIIMPSDADCSVLATAKSGNVTASDFKGKFRLSVASERGNVTVTK